MNSSMSLIGWLTDLLQEHFGFNKPIPINKGAKKFITYNSQTMTVTQWAKAIGMKRSTLSSRLRGLHWDEVKALTKPVKKRGKDND